MNAIENLRFCLRFHVTFFAALMSSYRFSDFSFMSIKISKRLKESRTKSETKQ